ncbi:MAG: tetratricopeptide repeat protein [Bacteroidota bacterium]
MKRLQTVLSVMILLTFAMTEVAARQIETTNQNQLNIQLADEYYQNGEIDKAQDLYRQVLKQSSNIPFIHNNYYKLLTSTEQYDEAEKYMKKVLGRYRGNHLYGIDLALLYKMQNKSDKYEKQIEQMIKSVGNSQNRMVNLAQNFIRKGIAEKALDLFLKVRKQSKSPYTYAIQLANIYRIVGNKDAMIDEYLNFAKENPQRISYVKNVLQNTLDEEEEFNQLEFKLIDLVQDKPDEEIYPELLIWVYLQRKDFTSAFVQARAFDKRIKGQGAEVINIGSIALSNDAYDDAIKIFDYIVSTYPNSPNYLYARRMSIKAQEEKVKNTYPVDLTEIQQLSEKYQQLYDFSNNSAHGLEAMRSKALLQAFYLDNLPEAIRILSRLLENPRASRAFNATCKIDLGDIYLLFDKPWESTLLYSQVEKAFEDSPLAYKAKLKNAKLHYYNGDFTLAKSHLDILKVATTREISNDAISLSLLISNNTYLDTVDLPLQKYAAAELLIYQNKDDQALQELNQLLNKYPSHNLEDEIYWSKSKIFREQAKPQQALEMLEKIVRNHSTDILGDDAYYTIANIYENDLQDVEKAQEYYGEFLKRYPGSVYIAQARKNFRKLRGDIIN